MADDLSRARHFDHRARLQPPGRRHPRSARSASGRRPMTEALSIRDLSITFARRGAVGDTDSVLDRIALDVRQGEILALVGESGSGKSITALAIMGLLPSRARITSGSITFAGRDILALRDTERRRLRGA